MERDRQKLWWDYIKRQLYYFILEELSKLKKRMCQRDTGLRSN